MSVIALRKFDGPMSAYLGKVHAIFLDFNELLPSTDTLAQELEWRNTFVMLLTLYGMPLEYSRNRDQILGAPTVPILSSTWSTLLQLPTKHTFDLTFAPITSDTSALVY